MSLDKAIAHGKEKRKPYYDSRRFDLTCRNHGTCPWCEGNRLFKRRAAEKAAEEETMSGTNPGAWPDQEPNEPQMSQYIDDGKREAFAELDKTIPLYTAADLAKAREEGRREAIKQLLVLGADGLGVYYDTGDRIVVDRRTYLIDADVFDALLAEGKKEQSDD